MATYTLLPDYLQMAIIYLKPNIDDHNIFNNRKVETGDPHPWPLAKLYNTEQLNTAATSSLHNYNTTAFLVIHRDSLLFEDYSETSISNSFSMAKSIVALLIGCAIDDGLIKSLDEKVTTYLPWLQGPYNDDLTIRQLLTMSSASDWNETYTSPFSITTKAYYGRNLKKTIREIEIIKHPGIVFRYCSGNTQLLSEILKEVTDKTLAQYASEKLWQPLGAEIPALWSLDRKDGREKAFCCFNSNARDFAKIGNLVLNKGRFNNTQIVDSQYIKEITTPVRYLTDDDAQMVDYYGLHWWIMNYEKQQIPYARGLMGQYIFVVPQYDAAIVRLGRNRSNEYRDHHPTDTYDWLKTGLEIIRQNQ